MGACCFSLQDQLVKPLLSVLENSQFPGMRSQLRMFPMKYGLFTFSLITNTPAPALGKCTLTASAVHEHCPVGPGVLIILPVFPPLLMFSKTNVNYTYFRPFYQMGTQYCFKKIILFVMRK